MPYIVYNNTNGEILRMIPSDDDNFASSQAGAPEEGYLWVDEYIDDSTHYVDTSDGDILDRPTLAIPEEKTLIKDQHWVLNNKFIPGTEIYADGLGYLETIDTPNEVLYFTDPGVYRLTIIPPFPYQTHYCKVTVSED